MAGVSKSDLARMLGVTLRSVERYQQRGCPCAHDDEGRVWFDPAVVQRWLEEQRIPAREASDGPPQGSHEPSPGAVSKDALHRAELARKLSIARKNELEIQAEKGLKELGLDLKIRGAKTLSQLAEVCAEFAAYVSSGTIQPQRSNALRQTLNMLERALRARESETKDDGRVFMVTAQARHLCDTFDRIGNGWRRAWLLDAAARHLEEDKRELPGFDKDMTSTLAALQLDLMGEPIGIRPAYIPPPAVPEACAEAIEAYRNQSSPYGS